MKHRHRPPRRSRCRRAGLLALAALPVLGPAPLPAVDFIRGDVNSDGRVSLADVEALDSFLFRDGPTPPCLSAGDVDDNGYSQLTDAIALLHFLFTGGPALCSPFHEPGPDPSPDLSCEAYGGGTPLADADARLALDDAAVDAGGHVTLTVRVSSSRHLAGFSGSVAVAGDLFANGDPAAISNLFADLSWSDEPFWQSAWIEGERLTFASLLSYRRPTAYPPGSEVPLVSLRACTDRGTPPGAYAATLVAGELVEAGSGRAIPPALLHATITIPEGLGPSAGCRSDPDPPRIPCSTEPPPDPAVFIRGDVVNDRIVSIADAAFLAAHFFREGAAPGCLDAADADDDGALSPGDLLAILDLVVAGGPLLCEPRSRPGNDPTPDELDCGSYIEAPYKFQPGEEIRIGDGTVEADGSVSLKVHLTNSEPLAGFSGTVSWYDLLGNGSEPVLTDLTGLLSSGYLQASVRDYSVTFSCLAAFTEGVLIPPGVDVPVLEIRTCVRPGTPPGHYPSNFVTAEFVNGESFRPRIPVYATGTISVLAAVPPDAGCPDLPVSPPGECGEPFPPPFPARGVDFARGDVNGDGRISLSDPVMLRRYFFAGDIIPSCRDAADANDDGSVDLEDVILLLQYLDSGEGTIPPPYHVVAPDPTPDAVPCRWYEVLPPQETDDAIRVGDIEAAPGEVVAVPVFLTNARVIEALQLLIEYDPAVFTPQELVFTRVLEVADFSSLKAGPGEGVFTVFIIGGVLTQLSRSIPPGTDTLVFKVRGTVASSAQPGSSVTLRPTNGPDGDGLGPEQLRNELTHRGIARYGSLLPDTLPGVLAIVPDLAIFIRGDSNDDARVDIADAQHVLSHLFLGGARPRCLDAADADDDGIVNVTDAIVILGRLFLGRGALPAPYPGQGGDPTGDGLGCGRR